MRYLSTVEYDNLVLTGLVRLGADEATVRVLQQARWPMSGETCLVEAAGRGVKLTLDDIQAYLDYFIAGLGVERFDAKTALFVPSRFDAMLKWLVEHGRGVPTFTGTMMEQQPRRLEAMLRSSTAAMGAN